MAGVLESWARRLLAVRRGAPPPLPTTGHGHRLVGGPYALTRLQMVPARSWALLLRPDRSVEVRRAGEVVAPALLRPPAADSTVLVVCTAPTRLRVGVPDVTTFDRQPLALVTLELLVEVEDADGLVALRALVAEHGVGLEAGLLAAVQREASTAVQGAVRMNRLADLQRLGLAEVLRTRWWPSTFAGGALRCHSVDVRNVSWPATADPAAGAVGPDRGEPDRGEQDRGEPYQVREQDEPTVPLPLARA